MKPEIELGEYKGLSVEKKEAVVEDADVDAAVEELRSRQAKMVIAEEGTIIEKGDFAIIDFAGTVDGEAFSGGEGKGYPLEVGSNSFIPGFEDQLVGLKKGDATDVEVTFPEDYFVKELAGKEAVFKVNVQDVKRKELPELNDEYVAANSEYKTVAELKASYKERMQQNAENNAKVEYEKALIDAAHEMGIAVIMDIVHSHAVKNEVEGLGNFAGDPNQYFYPGARREHPAWDSLCFDYGKNEVIHFLLSNCKYWLEEYKFDGFRFDGVTSMLYYSHGLGEAFCNYGDYFNGHQDDNAICYLTLANEVIHQVNPKAITIAEEVSGMPGLAAKVEDGGYGFDYRMAMNIPDYWIKTIKEKIDEDWKPSSMFWEVTNRRQDEKTISYAESHDQALVGDKTIIFRLIDADMYWHMQKGDENYVVNRGIALHKMIRLLTSSTINGGYLNFMGNEFGHPEWIDFPREGNGWSCKYARRQWDLVDNKNLTYHYMGDFDKEMLKVLKSVKDFQATPVQEIWHNDGDQVLAYERKDLIFVFNFNPKQSFTDYGFLVTPGAYEVILNTDDVAFGGNGLADDSVVHFTITDPLYKKEKKEWLKLYIPARTAVVLRKKK